MGLAKILEESRRFLGGITGLEGYAEDWKMCTGTDRRRFSQIWPPASLH
jgi:hypothetical protein